MGGCCSFAPPPLDVVPMNQEKLIRQWHNAVRTGDDKMMAKLLAQSPCLIFAVESKGCTALYHAAEQGHERVVALLLAPSPIFTDTVSTLINTVDAIGWTPLHCAAENGHETVVAQLLAASPGAIHAGDQRQMTALHFAVDRGHDRVVARLLEASPDSIDAVDDSYWTALHYAVNHDRVAIAEMLLSRRPELALAISNHGSTPLHLAAFSSRSREMLRLLTSCVNALPSSSPSSSYSPACSTTSDNLLADALRHQDWSGRTPFELAVAIGNEVAIEVLQWSLSFDELVTAFSQSKRNDLGRLAPLMKRVCEDALVSFNQDVLGLIYAYITTQH